MKSNPRPRVSVLLPVFNAAATLTRALDSIRNQSLADLELIVVDDGSTDDSRKISDAAADQDPRIKVVKRSHEGLARTLNVGLAHARAPLIARMDADDESFPDRLRLQVGAMDADPDLDLLGCRVEYGGDPESNAGYAHHIEWLNGLLEHDDILRARFVESPFAHPSVMFRRDAVERLGGYRDGPFPEDYELWLRWMDAGIRTGKVPETLLRWNDPPQRISRVDTRYSPEAFYHIKAGYLVRWIERNVGRERNIIAWGAGRLTRRRIEVFEGVGLRVSGYIDVDPQKQHPRPDGRSVLAPEAIPAPESTFILGCVATRGARDYQRGILLSKGYVEGRDFLFAA